MHKICFLLSVFVDFFGISFRDRIDDQPDRRVTDHEDPCENKDGDDAAHQPIVEQIGDKIANVQHAAVDRNCNR